jgi:hypothetical protein
MVCTAPNNKARQNLGNDPGWARFAAMAVLAGEAIGAAAPGLPRMPGGASSIDPDLVSAGMRRRTAGNARSGQYHGPCGSSSSAVFAQRSWSRHAPAMNK